MRILLDTNIVLSVFLSPNGRTADVIQIAVLNKHTFCLSVFSLDELRNVVKRKFPAMHDAFELFLAEFSYELLPTPVVLPNDMPIMRDINDLPILASAMLGDVDVLLTGDKDFEGLDVERPLILTPARFMQLYENETTVLYL